MKASILSAFSLGFSRWIISSHSLRLAKNDEGKIAFIYLFISLNICFGHSKEPSHRDGSFEHPQHMFW